MRQPFTLTCLALLLTACGDTNTQGNACFVRHVIDGSGSGADGVHLGDINGDGLPDVVTGWEESAELKLYLHPGYEYLRTGGTWTAVDIGARMDLSAIEDAAFVDLDDDGRLDAVVSATEGRKAAPNRRLRLHRPGADGVAATNWLGSFLHSEAPTEEYTKVRGAQLDGLHGAELVALSRDVLAADGKTVVQPGGVFLFTGPAPEAIGTPGAWQRRRLADVGQGKSIELVDMDADGDVDIVYSGARNMAWLENPLYETHEPGWARHWLGTASDLALCDIDGRGYRDVVGTASAREYPVVARWLRGTRNTWSKNRPWRAFDIRIAETPPTRFYQPQNVAVKSIACGHFRPGAAGNDPMDIIITNSGSGHGIVMLSPPDNLRRNPEAAWQALPLTDYQWIMKYDNIIDADIDGDGDLDFVTTEENEGLALRGAGVLWYENTGCQGSGE